MEILFSPFNMLGFNIQDIQYVSIFSITWIHFGYFYIDSHFHMLGFNIPDINRSFDILVFHIVSSGYWNIHPGIFLTLASIIKQINLCRSVNNILPTIY